MDYGALPPEINSGRMYAGPGAGPMLAAAAAWDGLSTELYAAAATYSSTISELTAGAWFGPASASMAAAAAPYMAWMSATATQAEQLASQAKAAAAAYEAAFAMTVAPPIVAENRAQLLMLIATNILGQNTPAIAATEAHYAEMWAQDAGAMYHYAGASAAASKVTPFREPPPTTNPTGGAGQAASVAHATGTSAGTNASTNPQLISSVPSTLQGLASSPASPGTTAPASGLGDLLNQYQDALLRTEMSAYFPMGVSYFLNSSTRLFLLAGNVGGGAAGSVAAGGAGALGLPGLAGMAGLGGGTSVSAGVGQAAAMGNLSVPPAWAAAAPANSAAAATSIMTPPGTPDASPAGLLRGLPLRGGGRRSGGFTHRYGFRWPVVPRSPQVG